VPKVSKITYNPSLSVKQNAVNNKCSESAIRYYIKNHDLDRRHERKQNIIAECKKYLKKNPKATRTELHEKTGFSLSTIRHYWEYISTEKELTDFNKNKIQKRLLRQDNNFYATHPSIVQDLLGVEKFGSKILEPFCGNGMIAETLKNNGYTVDAYDLIDRGYGKQGDFFKTDYEEGVFDIVTNPPYDENLPIIAKRCLELCKDKVAFLLPINYLSGKTRLEVLYTPFPPVRVYVYSDRILIGKNGIFAEQKANLSVYVWVIWEKWYKGKTELRWIVNKNFTSQNIIAEIRQKIDTLINIERHNGEVIEKSHLVLPSPTVQNLTRWEEYDASKYLCYAFKKKGDLRKGVWIPFGNMNKDFPFNLCGYECQTSESAYICGMFSDNTPKHIELQDKLLKLTNGKLAKGDIRYHNQHIARKDWYEYNVQWMLYVVWQKVKGNEKFRNLLLAVPDGATIIEDTTFQKKSSTNDTTQFWGARNQERKEFDTIIDDYIKKTKANSTKGEWKRLKAASLNDFTDYGTYRGCNVMGKILMICRQCVKDGTEPDIDYDLLRSKHIHLLGKELTF